MPVSSTSSQPVTSQISILTILLSSSVLLAIITGLFYLVGYSWVQGYRYALGLNYLSNLQPSEYIAAGAEALLVPSFLWMSAIAATGVATVVSANVKRISRAWETWIAVPLLSIASIVIIAIALKSVNTVNALIASTCSVRVSTSDAQRAIWALCIPVAVSAFGFFRFEPRRTRYMFLVWGSIAFAFSLAAYGRALGTAHLDEKFHIVEIGSISLQMSPQARLLLLDTDDKNLVVLTPNVSHDGHPEPKYLLRSEVQSFSIVGMASINDFVCSVKSRPATPPGH